MKALHYILDGHTPIPCPNFDEWYAWVLQRDDWRITSVAADHVGDILISTVFLGFDHRFGEGQPILFETIVFGGPKRFHRRYATWDEALAGHQEILKAVLETEHTGY